MKKILTLLVPALLGITNLAIASHNVGAEISYRQVAINSYQLTLKHYRDCSGPQPATTASINLKALNCNTGRNISLNLASRKMLNPYGPAVPVSCTSTGRFNIEVISYSGTLTFSASEAACANWVLSFGECCRATTANLVGQGDFYTETNLKLTAGVLNSSPVFDTLHAPVMFVGVGLPYNLSMAATDPDGDSLVYSFVTPLSAAFTPVTYKPFPAPNTLPGLPPTLIVNPNPRPPFSPPFNPQFAQVTGGPFPATYNPQYPMPSIYVNWNGPATIPYPGAPNGMIWEATNKIELNPVNGELKFSPYRFITAGGFENKYVVSIMVDEYRKVNGQMTKLGSVRRETIFEVVDGGGLAIPEMVSLTANGQNLTPG